MQQYRKRNPKVAANERQPLSASRSAQYLEFAIKRGYDPVAQITGMEMEGVDIAVLFPTMGLSLILIARDDAMRWTRSCLMRFARHTTTGSMTSANTAPTNSSSRRCCRSTT